MIGLSASAGNGFGASLGYQTVQSGVQGAVRLVRGENVEAVLSQVALASVSQTLAQQGASGIGRWYGAEKIDAITHKVAHGLNAAATSALGNPRSMGSAAFAGALGAVVAETFVELASPDAEMLNQRLQERADAENIDLRDAAQREGLVRSEMSGLIGAGETLAASTAMLFDQDPTLAASSARMALENNFLPCLLLAGSALYEAYDVLCIYRAEGSEAALKAVAMKLGVAAATVTVGGPVLKAVVSKAMAANPALAKALGVFGEKLVSVSNAATEALGTTAVGRSVLAVEASLQIKFGACSWYGARGVVRQVVWWTCGTLEGSLQAR